MKKYTNTALNTLAKLTYATLQIIKCLQDDILSRDTYPILEQEADYEKATESLWDAAVALSNLTDPEERDLSFFGTENLDTE